MLTRPDEIAYISKHEFDKNVKTVDLVDGCLRMWDRMAPHEVYAFNRALDDYDADAMSNGGNMMKVAIIPPTLFGLIIKSDPHFFKRKMNWDLLFAHYPRCKLRRKKPMIVVSK